MLKRLHWFMLLLLSLAILSASCYGKTDVDESGVFTCQNREDCLPGFECRTDPAKGGTLKFCMKLDVSQVGGAEVCADSDGDGFGDKGNAAQGFKQCQACSNPAFPRNGLDINKICSGEIYDCDDSKSNVYPGAIDVCDGLDNDCDGMIDNEVPKSCNFLFECAGGASTVTIGGESYQIACENSVCVLKTFGGKLVQCEGGRYVEKP